MTYDRENYNCSHVVAEYYRDRLGVTLPVGAPSDWQLRFMLFMRRRFTRIVKPVQDCLIVVRNGDGSLHVGVYDQRMMYHGHTCGQVIRTPLPLVTGEKSYWSYHGND